MSDKTPTKKRRPCHDVTRARRNKPPKSEKLQQYKKAIAAEQTLRTTADVSSLQNREESAVFQELERLENVVVVLENEQKRLYPILNTPLDNFIVAFVNPTYPMAYFVNTDYKLKLECARITSDLLYKNKNEVAINRPKISSFKLQLNDVILDTIETIEYDLQNKVLTITAPVQDQELRKSIIYFNILNSSDSWEVPKYMKNCLMKCNWNPRHFTIRSLDLVKLARRHHVCVVDFGAKAVIKKYKFNNYVKTIELSRAQLSRWRSNKDIHPKPLDRAEILRVEKATRGQSKNELWTLLRLDRSTASASSNSSGNMLQRPALLFGNAQESHVKETNGIMLDHMREIIKIKLRARSLKRSWIVACSLARWVCTPLRPMRIFLSPTERGFQWK